ncbi:MAG: TrmH family RNA methyltransferase [Deltaproteobacteria bacterium]|nr:TrmH family RNA methyltransferase [Deltaproteobacteria bacterium]
MNTRLKRYRKDFTYSYANGVFSTIELLDAHPEHVSSVIISPSGEGNTGIDKIKGLCKKYDIPVDVNEKTVERISQQGKHLAIGVFNKYRSSIEPAKDHIVLVNPSDMGNIGTIARTMLGFGIFNLALIRPAVDYFDPKAIRASMGAVFRLNIEYFDSLKAYRNAFGNNLYLFRTGEDGNIRDVRFHKPFTLVFGNESSGLPDDPGVEGITVSIPQSGKVDSLNLSVAAGIAIYESSRPG